MKSLKLTFYLTTFIMTSSFLFSASDHMDTGFYFEQEKPGTQPQVFAPGIISDAGYRLHGFPSFSADIKEVVWPVIPPGIMQSSHTEHGWSQPQKTSFSQRNIQACCFSPDGARIYFQMSREDGMGSLDIWYVERKGDEWSEPINLGAPVNSDQMESQPSISTNGNIYFVGKLEGTGLNRGIFVSEKINGQYQSPSLLPEIINSPFIDYTPFISPDERLLLFSSSRPGNEEKDLKLFISFKSKHGNWQEPVNLSKILGLNASARFPSLSPDGQYLFYLSEGKIFWVSAAVLPKSQ